MHPLRTPLDVVCFDAVHEGPPGMVNGGYLAGSLARRLTAPAVTVTLRTPTPPGRPLRVRSCPEGIELVDGDRLLAVATADTPPRPVPPPVGEATAEDAERSFAGLREHPFPGCYVCGTERGAEALNLRPGPTVAGSLATTWTVGAAQGDRDGVADVRTVWAALDCPTAWVHFQPGGVAVLGRITGTVTGTLPRVGDRCVVVARARGRDGRKLRADSAVYGPGGHLVAHAAATWIQVAAAPPVP